MVKILLRIGDFFFVLRPLLLIPAWSFLLLGASAGSGRSPIGGKSWGLPNGMACLSAIMITAYLLNQVFDQESDRRNDKCHYLTRGIFAVRTVVLLALIFFLIASFLFRSTEPSQKIPLVLALILSLTYSLPPLRLVARPFADLFANAVGYGGIAFVVGYCAFYPFTWEAAARSLPYVFLVGATFLHTTILDAKGDVESGKSTTTVRIGVGRSAGLACCLAGAGVVWALAVSMREFSDGLAPVILTISLVMFFFGAARLKRSDGKAGENTKISSNVVQAATALVTIPAAAAWPVYLVLIIPLVVVSRLYYRARFNLGYPGPAGPAKGP